MTSKKVIKSAFESMLFVWGEMLPAKDAAEVFDISEKEAIEYFQELAKEYEEEGRGLRIRQVGKAFQLVTLGENEEFIRRLCTPTKVKKLSQAALEVLAIIAYKQPVTKGEIEQIRGIKCDRVLEGLMKKELVRNRGRSDAVGRPILYGTTDVFLKQFGFSSLKELPKIEDIEGLMGIDDEEEENLEESRQLAMQIEGMGEVASEAGEEREANVDNGGSTDALDAENAGDTCDNNALTDESDEFIEGTEEEE